MPGCQEKIWNLGKEFHAKYCTCAQGQQKIYSTISIAETIIYSIENIRSYVQ